MKTIRLYGSLGDQFGKVHQYHVASPAEAVRAMCATIDGFKKVLIEAGNYYRVSVSKKNDLSLEETLYPSSDNESISIIPVVSGSGGGFGKILLGAALVGLAFAFPAASATFNFGALGSTSISLASMASNIGISLILGGVSQMLFKPPKAQTSAERPENKPSFIFNGAVNTTTQGNAVPVCYGKMIVGSQVISAGLSVEQI